MKTPLGTVLIGVMVAAIGGTLTVAPAHAVPPASLIGAASAGAAPRTATAADVAADRGSALNPSARPPVAPQHGAPSHRGLVGTAAACSAADFGSRTGTALVSFVKAATVDCVNTLFSITGTTANSVFREAQMTTIAYALRDTSATYPGDNSTSALQLVVFLRAGYYVQFYHPGDVGTYGSVLVTAIRAGLDRFFGSARSTDVNDANGAVLSEAVILIDSSGENVRYLFVVKRLLTGFNSAYDASWYMRSAVNATFTVLWRGHQLPAFLAAVVADQSVLDVLYSFVSANIGLLGTDSGYLVANAGGELTRFLDTPALLTTVRGQAKGLLNLSAMTGPRASLWVRVADLASYLDGANCAYYGICGFETALAAAVLPITHTCSASLKIRAQDISAANLAASCTSLAGQIASFHTLVRDNGVPVADDFNSTLEVVAFHSSDDYQTYAGVLFDIDTNNGGMYLEGDPATQGNVPRFIAYEAEWLRPVFAIWNLNHEFTHYLDGRFDTYGDFTRTVSVPNIWWVEGVAEYVSYTYRGVNYDAAITAAGQHTYALSTLWGTTYDNSDSSRIYSWGYLAVRYMFEKHPADIHAMLARFRVNDYTGGRAVYATTIGTRYDADFQTWLTACAAGACAGTPPVNTPPTARFTSAVTGLSAAFTDGSTDADGTITGRSWSFGDGTSSTAANPVHAYATAGTYQVTLTVTDNLGATGSVTNPVVATSAAPECTGADIRTLDRNCRRSGLAASAGQLYYLYIYLPAGVSTLTITSAGGTGNADLYYNASTWATSTAYTSRSVNAGNTEQLTVSNPAAGYRYISLYATTAFSGVSVTTRY
ncbi:microbial collagenase [Allocatelliglobosispora scoriae]|uniref:microbial collagenase n=1 Tax=Allocatelliglobosispora scoriae TaxID=643052 RepID=A0A841C1E0_9ACTN|nr:collagenase [Allocatelliglobosispora scoriae]MBB5873745.1 microbial collagenase [Allocatelliglobosispora scoriae]